MLARWWEGDMYYMTTFTTLFAASLASRRDAGDVIMSVVQTMPSTLAAWQPSLDATGLGRQTNRTKLMQV